MSIAREDTKAGTDAERLEYLTEALPYYAALAASPPPAEGIVAGGVAMALLVETVAELRTRAEAAEAELASIKALPPLHEQIVRMAPEGNRGHE